MTEPLGFYELIRLEKVCPRRTAFKLLGIKGRAQYYPAKRYYEKTKIHEFLKNKFPNAKLTGISEKLYGNFAKRLEKEDVSALMSNLDTLISENEINASEINKYVSYSVNDVAVGIFIDLVGMFEGKSALFKLNLTSRINRNDALELACAEVSVGNSNRKVERLLILKLGSGEVREIFKDGDRTKKGELSKRGLPPWEELRKEADNLIKNAYNLRKKMEQNPESYNNPVFGTCGTCPYHNFEIKFKGKKIICTG